MSQHLVRDIVVSFLSGVLLATAFPLLDWSVFAWCALVPLLLVLPGRPFLNGFSAGFGFFGTALYWLNIVMVTYGRLPLALSILAYLLLVAYLALYFALPVWLAERFRVRRSLPLVLTLPVLWVVFEYLRGIALTGFPWSLIGYSQHAASSLIQSADLVGVYGIGALIVFANCLLARCTQALWSSAVTTFPFKAAVVFMLLFSMNFGYGVWRLRQNPDRIDNPVTVGLIQGNIDQAVKWDPDYQLSTVQTYLSLSEKAVNAGARLLVWPESATPFYLQDPSSLSQAVRQSVARTGHYLLTGSPAYEYDRDGIRYLNSAFLLSPEGEFLGRTDKTHLVPFGEYVPFGQFLPFVNKLVTGIGDFSAGLIRPARMPHGQLGVLVCYEGIFPDLARKYVLAGSGVLVNVTNDAWFGRSSAPYQHLAMTRFRAIETRRWLVRSANTGISAIIAPSGTIVSSSALFQQEIVTGDITFLSGMSLYTRMGDILPLACVLLSLTWLVQSRKEAG